MYYQGFIAAMSPGTQYCQKTAISRFFAKTSTCSNHCDEKAISIVGGMAVPVAIQGNCSYSIFAGQNLEYVFQFRLSTLPLSISTLHQARKVHGSLVPEVWTYGQLEDLHVYAMPRIQGVSYLDFVLADKYPRTSHQSISFRSQLMADIGRFFACSWKAPQRVSPDFRSKLRAEYIRDLESLLHSLPCRFENIIQRCLDSIDAILALPAVLLHRDFSTANLIVSEKTCQLKGVLDWGEAGIGIFGMNLHFLQTFMCVLELPRGWQPHDDYQEMQETFWRILKQEVRDLQPETIENIKLASSMGLLLYRGFTRRLAGMPNPTPVGGDAEGLYSLLYLDAFLLRPESRICN